MRLATASLGLLVALGLGACSGPTGVVVTFTVEQGAAPSNLQSIDLALVLAGRAANTTLREKSGAALALPTDATLEIRSGAGALTLVAVARNAAGQELGRGHAEGTVVAGQTLRVTVPIQFEAGGGDGGEPDGAPMGDGGGDGGGVAAARLVMDNQPSFDFGTVVVGTSSSDLTVTVTNQGGAASGVLGPAALVGAGANQFQLTDGCKGQTLLPAAHCALHVTLMPTAAGTPTATLGLDATPGGAVSTQLSGHAVNPGMINVTPSPALFGSHLVNNETSDVTLTAMNSGNAPSGAVTASLSGSHADQYSILGGTCQSHPVLAPGNQCTVQVRFTPTVLGPLPATLVIDAMPGGPGVANLQGTGLSASALAFDMATYDFLLVETALTPTVTATLHNSGTEDSGPLGDITLSGDATLTVTSGGTCVKGTPVPGLGSCTVMLQFAPTVYGARNATLATSATPGGSPSAAVTGTGRQKVTLTVDKVGSNGPGTVTSNPSAINCDLANTTCAVSYEVTTTPPMLTLSNMPGTNVRFDHYAGDCSGTSCMVTLDKNRNVSAVFIQQYNVTVTSKLVRGGGITGAITSTSSPTQTSQINCASGNTCTVAFDSGMTVTLSAAAGGGGIFQSWTTACANRFSTTCSTGALAGSFSTTATFRPQINYVFVTSTTMSVSAIGNDLSGADAQCNSLARAAGLFDTQATPNVFVALLSTKLTSTSATVNAKDRLALAGVPARGWMRVDGKEFADLRANLFNESGATKAFQTFYPPAITETGTDVGTFQFALTASDNNGLLITTGDGNCTNFTSTSAANFVNLGSAGGGTTDWLIRTSQSGICASTANLYCFERQFTTAVSPASLNSATQRMAFLSTAKLASGAAHRDPAGTAGSADAICASEKVNLPAPFNTGTYLALMSDTNSAASLRFAAGGLPWVRPDGVLIAPTQAALMAWNIIAPINVTAQTLYTGGGVVNTRAWTGSALPTTAAPTDTDTCNSWSSTASAAGIGGVIGDAVRDGFGGLTTACTTATYFVYCLEQ